MSTKKLSKITPRRNEDTSSCRQKIRVMGNLKKSAENPSACQIFSDKDALGSDLVENISRQDERSIW
jgi:hypothetical protein